MASSTQTSFAAMAQKEQRKPPLRMVQLEGQVLLKISQHCKENSSFNTVVTGQLLGLDVGQTLEVTDCFPFPSNLDDNDDHDGADYQLEMMRCLREINVDNNMVGWYQSTVSGSYQVVEIIETFVNYLENLERCICIVYDVTASLSGSFGIKVIRLADSFVEAFREGTLTIEKIRSKGLSWKSVFVEIPISIHNSPMAVALMAEIENPSGCTQLDFDRLGLGVAPILEKSLEFLNDCLDDLVGEQNKLSMYHNQKRRYHQAVNQWKMQRKQENQTRKAMGETLLSEEPPEGEFKEPTEPGQLDNMLLANQMTAYTSHINSTVGQAVEKLVLMERLQNAL